MLLNVFYFAIVVTRSTILYLVSCSWNKNIIKKLKMAMLMCKYEWETLSVR